MNFEQLMKEGWKARPQEVKSVEDQLRERLLRAETKIFQLERENASLRRVAYSPSEMPEILPCVDKNVRRKMIASHTRRLVYSISGGSCFYCRKELTYFEMTIDHQIPVVKGGSNAKTNLVAACSPCNGAKSGRMPTADELERAAIMRKDYRPPTPVQNVVPITDPDWQKTAEAEIEARIAAARES